MTPEKLRSQPFYQQEKLKAETRKAVQEDLAPKEDWTDWKSIVEYDAPTPSMAFRSDGRPLGYAGSLLSTWGWAGAGKSWLYAFLAAQDVKLRKDVYWLDLEGQRGLLADRFRKCGLTDEQISTYVHYNNPERAPNVDKLRKEAAGGLIVIDSFTGLQNRVAPGSDSNSTDAVDLVYSSVLVPLLNEGCTVHLVDHVTKERRDGADSPIGSQRKLSMLDLGWNLVEKDGYSTLIVRKDRHANFSRGDHVAALQWHSQQPVLLEHYVPEAGAASNLPVTPEALIVAEAVRAANAGNPYSKNMFKVWLGRNGTPRQSESWWRDRVQIEVEAGHLEEFTVTGRGNAKYLRLPEAQNYGSLPGPTPEQQAVIEMVTGTVRQS